MTTPRDELQAQPGPLYVHDAVRALDLDDTVGVHIELRWANRAARWEVCLVDRDTGEPSGPWVFVEPRPEALLR